MEMFVNNLRYLLWKHKSVDRQNWSTLLAGLAQCSVEAALKLLKGDLRPDSATLKNIAQASERTEEDILFSDLLGEDRGTDILTENIKRLCESLAFGEKKILARKLKVSEITLSRWQSGSQRPRPKKIRQLASEFYLPPEIDLTTTPLFLDPSPILVFEQREWILKKVQELDARTLDALFHLLRNMTRE